MHYCPHCHKPTAKSAGPCPHCGKELGGDQAPAKATPAGPAAVDALSVHGELSMDESGGSLDLALDPAQARMTEKQRSFSVKAGVAAAPAVKPKPGTPETGAAKEPGDDLDLAVDIRRATGSWPESRATGARPRDGSVPSPTT
jgi:hypothetical protein